MAVVWSWSVCFLLIDWLQNWVAWFVVRFLVGFLINPLYILGEVWAAFALIWGAGGIVGPPGVGLAMQWTCPLGMPATILALSLALVAYAAWRARRGGTA